MRLVYLTFITETNSVKSDFFHSHEGNLRLSVPLLILSVGSIFFGYATKDMMIGVGTPFYGAAVFTLPSHVTLLDAEFMPVFIKWVPVLLSFSGAFLAMVLYSSFSSQMSKFKLTGIGSNLYTFLNNK
jgi:NADH-ubiquinone oxidoreductase chain 5